MTFFAFLRSKSWDLYVANFSFLLCQECFKLVFMTLDMSNAALAFTTSEPPYRTVAHNNI